MFDRLNPEVRIALMQAADEVRELGDHRLGPEHLLLGLLTNVRGSAYQLLTEHGLTYQEARKTVVAKHEDRSDEDPADDADDASSSLDDDREALRAIGIDLDKVRDAVRSAFGDDITDGWGERRGRRRGRGRGRGGPHNHGHRGMPSPEDLGWGGPAGPRDFGPEDWADFGPRGGGRGRRGPHSRRFGGGPARLSPSIRPVWEQVRTSLREGSPFTGVTLLEALIDAGDPVVDAVLAGADDLDALRAEVRKHTARPEAG